MTNITLFSQIIPRLDRSIFNKLVKKYKTDKHQKGFNSWSHLVSMLFSQFSNRQIHLKEWDNFGQLGDYCFDNQGNLFIFPRPFVNRFSNPSKEQNKLLILDSKTAKISEFISFDNSLDPKNNPFGIMDVKYDCSTGKLYTCSIYASDRKKERGIIYSIDKKTKKISNKIEDIDAISLGLFYGKNGKKLYFGSARKPYLYSVLLDSNGNFSSEPKLELKLNLIDKGSQDNIIAIVFKKDRMYLTLIPFAYSMFAAIDPNVTVLTFKYNISTDKWEFVSSNK